MLLTKPLFLVGLRASGKTSLGKRLMTNLSLPLYDTDEIIQTKEGMDIATMVSLHGWQYFRDQESDILRSIESVPCIVSTGGGIVLNQNNRTYIKNNGLCVYLNPPLDSLILRLMYNPLKGQRPSLISNFDTVQTSAEESLGDEVKRTFLERDHLYKEIADFTIDTSKDMQIVVDKVLAYFAK